MRDTFFPLLFLIWKLDNNTGQKVKKILKVGQTMLWRVRGGEGLF